MQSNNFHLPRLPENNFISNEKRLTPDQADRVLNARPIEEKYPELFSPDKGEKDIMACKDNRIHPVYPVDPLNESVLPVCYMIAKFSDGLWRSSGFKVAKNLYITSGHCIYDHKKKEFAEYVEIYQALHHTDHIPYGMGRTSAIMKCTGYVGGDHRNDIGAVTLAEPGLNSPFYQIGFNKKMETGEERMAGKIRTTGYPVDKSLDGLTDAFDDHLSVDQYITYYKGLMVVGSSGSPVHYSPDNLTHIAYAVAGFHWPSICKIGAVRFSFHKEEIINWVQYSEEGLLKK